MFTVSIENGFDFLSPEYAELFRESAATGFQAPVWLANFYARLAAPGRAEPLIILVRSGPKRRIAMVLPLVRRRLGPLWVVEFADLGVSDYASAVCSPATFAEIVENGRVGEEIQSVLRPFDLLRIQKLPAAALPLHQLFKAATPAVMEMSAFAVALQRSYPEWRETRLNPSYRKELDKKARQLERKGLVQFECLTDPAKIEAAFAQMRIYRFLRFEGREGRELLQLESYYQFYMNVALDGRDGSSRTYALYLDDRPVAVVFGLALNQTFLVLLGGFDHAGFKNLSLGALTFERVARDCIERGDALLDFTIGDEPYKLLFGSLPTRMGQIALPGSPVGWLANSLYRHLPGARDFAKRLFATGSPTNGLAADTLKSLAGQRTSLVHEAVDRSTERPDASDEGRAESIDKADKSTPPKQHGAVESPA